MSARPSRLLLDRYPRSTFISSCVSVFIPSKRDKKRAVTYYEQRLVASGWIAWRQYIKKCRVKNDKYQLACQHHQSIVIKKYFTAWKNHHLKVCLIKQNRGW